MLRGKTASFAICSSWRCWYHFLRTRLWHWGHCCGRPRSARSKQRFSSDGSVSVDFSITVFPVSDSIFQSMRLYDTRVLNTLWYYLVLFQTLIVWQRHSSLTSRWLNWRLHLVVMYIPEFFPIHMCQRQELPCGIHTGVLVCLTVLIHRTLSQFLLAIQKNAIYTQIHISRRPKVVSLNS